MAERHKLDSTTKAFLAGDEAQVSLFDPKVLRSRLERKNIRSRERFTVDLDSSVSARMRIACAHLGCNQSDFAREVILQALIALGY